MSVAIYYPNCGTTLSDYNCSPCPPTENARVRSMAFVKNSYTWTNPANPVEWATAVQQQNAIVIWQTQGNYDMASAELTGFGDVPFYNGNGTHTIVFKDPNAIANIDHYNDIRSSQEYTCVYRTSSRIWLAAAPCIFTPKAPVVDDITGIVTIECTVKWVSQYMPTPYITPAGIFDRCYIV